MQGLKVAVIEGHDIGGTCVNRGCVPSKALLAASGRIRDMKNEHHLKSMGIQVAPTTHAQRCTQCLQQHGAQPAGAALARTHARTTACSDLRAIGSAAAERRQPLARENAIKGALEDTYLSCLMRQQTPDQCQLQPER